ncbi:MAG: DUF5320 domain-containing protein [Thermodesulfobacteria bacterium]|nr:DUF5320 domain-containing protein [Thermodesulfobacteriota bacterium]
MPGFNNPVPMGAGQGAGRRRGRCFRQQGANCRMNQGPRRQGRGAMAGFCRRGFGQGSGNNMAFSQDERELLLQEKSWLEQRLEAIRDRLASFGQ